MSVRNGSGGSALGLVFVVVGLTLGASVYAVPLPVMLVVAYLICKFW